MTKDKIQVPSKMSWDEPIEQDILSFVRAMKYNWQSQEARNSWGSVRKQARSIIMAYECVEKHIVKQIEIRESRSSV